MERKKHRWWLLGILVAMFFGFFIFTFWDAILIRVAPKMVLTTALNDLFFQLEQRFQGNPLLIVSGSLDPEGKYTVDMDLETERELLGPVTYDMTLQTNGMAHQLLAKGTASTSSKAVDLSLYLDSDFMAVSSVDLVGGIYYGITYDTFAADMRQIPFMNYLINDSLLQKWESSIQEIQANMGRTYALPGFPETSPEDLRKTLMGIAALPCKAQKCAISLSDITVTGYKLDFSVSGQQIKQLLSGMTDSTDIGEGTAAVSFYLYENSIVKIDLLYEAEGSSLQYCLDLGQNPLENLLSLQGTQRKNGEGNKLAITVATQNEENQYTETWNIQQGSDDPLIIAFTWNPLSGDMTLKTSVAAQPCLLNLSETENGFRMTTDDLLNLVNALSPNEQTTQKDDKISCVMNVSRGSEIVTPAYKNLDQWSMEDFLVLLNGVGSLLGIGIQ